jgi:hemerythrin
MTKKFKWNDKYSVKVPSLDEQHKKFFDITNQIIDVLEKPHNPALKERLILLLVKLGIYAQYHLDYEENCINRYKCKGCETHPGAHALYRSKVKNYLQQVQIEGTDIYKLSGEVAEFSQTWLSTHILHKDREYISCLEHQNLD